MVKMICEINPSYKKYVLTNKTTGKKRLYRKVTKAMYERLLRALPFYQKLSGQLYEWGCKQNLYAPCPFNETIDGRHMTTEFRADYLKLLHMDQWALDTVVRELNDVLCTTQKELAETKGNVHEYLGHVVFTMYDYIEDIIGALPVIIQPTTSVFILSYLSIILWKYS